MDKGALDVRWGEVQFQPIRTRAIRNIDETGGRIDCAQHVKTIRDLTKGLDPVSYARYIRVLMSHHEKRIYRRLR